MWGIMFKRYEVAVQITTVLKLMMLLDKRYYIFLNILYTNTFLFFAKKM